MYSNNIIAGNDFSYNAEISHEFLAEVQQRCQAAAHVGKADCRINLKWLARGVFNDKMIGATLVKAMKEEGMAAEILPDSTLFVSWGSSLTPSGNFAVPPMAQQRPLAAPGVPPTLQPGQQQQQALHQFMLATGQGNPHCSLDAIQMQHHHLAMLQHNHRYSSG